MQFEYDYDLDAWAIKGASFKGFLPFNVGDDLLIYPKGYKGKEERLLVTVDQFSVDGEIIVDLKDEYYEPSGFSIERLEKVDYSVKKSEEPLNIALSRLIANELDRFTCDIIRSYDFLVGNEMFESNTYIVKDTIKNESYKMVVESNSQGEITEKTIYQLGKRV